MDGSSNHYYIGEGQPSGDPFASGSMMMMPKRNAPIIRFSGRWGRTWIWAASWKSVTPDAIAGESRVVVGEETPYDERRRALCTSCFGRACRRMRRQRT